MKNPATKLPIVGSLWQEKGLNPKLIASIRPVIEGNIEGGQGEQTYSVDTSQPIVAALLEDADFSIEAQYSTPFESSNPEGRMPNLMGMIQSGQANAAYYSLFAASSDPSGFSSLVADGAAAVGEFTGATDVLKQAETSISGLKGRSNFTKLNSRQIYTSSNSVRISATLVFQAWANAKAEVEDAINLLQQWASPAKLSEQSLLVAGVSEGISEGMFPSIIPPLVQLQYGGKLYKPMVIESVSAPITAPMNANGDRIAVRAQVTFLSLNAWDKADILNTRR